MTTKYQKEDNLEIWHYKDGIWYRETTHMTAVGGSPHLYDSDWDYYGETDVVCEFVLDETQNMSMEKRNELRQVVRELNHQLGSVVSWNY